MRPRCSQGRRSWILHRASMGHRTIGGPPKHCRNGFWSNHGDSCLYKTCIIWQSRSFKIIAGCRFTDIQNFQDLSLGVQRQKKHVFKIVEVESLKFLSKDSSRTEASRPLFNQRSISPPLRSNTSVLNLQMSPKPHESFQGTNLMTFSFSMLLVLRTGMTPMAGVEAQKRWYKTCCCHMR